MANDNYDLGAFIGGILGRAIVSGADSVLEDGEKTLTKATERLQKARIKIRQIKESDNGGETEK
jgi:hypothetical protein